MPQSMFSYKRCPDCRRTFYDIADKPDANKVIRVSKLNKVKREVLTCPNCGKNNVKGYVVAIPGRFNEKAGFKWPNVSKDDKDFKDPDEKETELMF